jgi:hypothetical protein
MNATATKQCPTAIRERLGGQHLPELERARNEHEAAASLTPPPVTDEAHTPPWEYFSLEALALWVETERGGWGQDIADAHDLWERAKHRLKAWKASKLLMMIETGGWDTETLHEAVGVSLDEFTQGLVCFGETSAELVKFLVDAYQCSVDDLIA